MQPRRSRAWRATWSRVRSRRRWRCRPGPRATSTPSPRGSAGRRLCEDLLEPLQDHWGPVRIRSAYRSSEVNALGNQLQRQRKAGYNCASNEANAAGHIWDLRDTDGRMGATACVVVPSFWDAHHEPGDWQIMARWIDETLPYSTLEFLPQFWALNVSWHERPQ